MTAEEAYVRGGDHLDGLRGMQQSDKAAVRYFAKAAKAGHAGGQRRLGWCYKKGRGVEKDFRKAVRLYHRASSNGDADALAHLGWCCIDGLGVDKDIFKAVDFFLLAADAGSAIGQNVSVSAFKVALALKRMPSWLPTYTGLPLTPAIWVLTVILGLAMRKGPE